MPYLTSELTLQLARLLQPYKNSFKLALTSTCHLRRGFVKYVLKCTPPLESTSRFRGVLPCRHFVRTHLQYPHSSRISNHASRVLLSRLCYQLYYCSKREAIFHLLKYFIFADEQSRIKYLNIPPASDGLKYPLCV